MAHSFELNDKVVIVTGGGRGVGRGITRRFLEEGADVVICGRNEPDETIEADGREAVFTAADVRECEQIESVIDFTKERFDESIGVCRKLWKAWWEV